MPWSGQPATKPASPAELQQLRRDAWQQHGVLTVKADDVVDELIQRILIALATDLYGPRAS